MIALINPVSLTIVVPFRNERALIASMVASHALLQRAEIEFRYVDDGSSDGSAEELRRLAPDVKILRLEGDGTGKAFLAGARDSRSMHILLLPIDCVVSPESVDELFKELRSERVIFFPKIYTGTNTMSLYASAQNMVLLRGLRLASWTNGVVFHCELLGALERATTQDFLCDLELSRNLRRESWHVLRCPIFVSPRRYEQDGAWRRILLNGLILMLWQFKLVSVQRLHHMYKRGKNG